MNTYQAALDTMVLAESDCELWAAIRNPAMSIVHLRDMMERWPHDGSETKKSRWLGWMQAVVVSQGYPRITLETVKQINKANAPDVLEVPSDASGALEFLYTNYKGVTRKRIATPVRHHFGSTEHHPQEQWFIFAYDHEKEDFRDFALADCSFASSAEEADLHEHIARQDALIEKRFKDVNLVSFVNGTFQFEGSMFGLIAEHMAQSLGHRQKTEPDNYLEVSMEHPEVGELTLTLQRKSGLTPHQGRKAAEDRVAAMTAAIDPVIHWYQSDEHDERPLPDILADIVEDLQSDRAELLELKRSSNIIRKIQKVEY